LVIPEKGVKDMGQGVDWKEAFFQIIPFPICDEKLSLKRAIFLLTQIGLQFLTP
jgi:hypothetical protein